ncbi:MAG: CxxxxCH/CxxCH domain-containing protein [Geobacteraceae bacterium]|nr:CxxxxCH/CxxCH domain-containing protein [Geobacteraceae bacterium]
MKRTSVVTWVIVLVAIAIPMYAGAALPTVPHTGSGITCNTCHTANSLGPAFLVTASQTSPALYNNACQHCHRQGDANANAKPLSPSDASIVFGGHSTNAGTTLKQTSHRWDGSDYNLAAGAQPPIQALMTSPGPQGTQGRYNLRGRTGNQLACVRCHSMHNGSVLGSKSLRMPNTNDEMCLDCHRSRNQQSHLSGTHPVNINYNSTAGAFNKPPLNANPSNATSDLNAKLTATGGNIVCSTCHGVHYTDSRSSTVDGSANFANLSASDGYVLVTDRRGAKVSSAENDKLNICTNCHASKKSHNAKDQNVQCTDCHGAHVEYDKDDPNNTKGTNVYLVRRDVTKAGMPGKVYFRYTGSQREYKNAEGTGVCQGCHDVPAPGGIYPPEHASNNAKDCNTCHYHSSQAGSFSGACGKCHGNPPTTAAIGGPAGLAAPATGALDGSAGAHNAHVNIRKMDCNACHNRYANKVMPSNTIDLEFDVTPGTFPGFRGIAANGSYNTPAPSNAAYSFVGSVNVSPTATRTCANVYCHGGTLPSGGNPSWVGGPAEVACGKCHTVNGNALNGSHPAHAGGSLNLACATCHPAIPANDTSHMQGSVQFDLSGINTAAQYKPAGGTYALIGDTGRLAPSASYGTCNTIYCHGQATNLPWGGSLWSTTETCAKCHGSQTTVTASGAFYTTAYPVKVSVRTDSKVGAHVSHLNSTYAMSGNAACSDCHGTVALNTPGHMNGTTSFDWSALATKNGTLSPTFTGGVCSNTYCHGAAQTGGTNKSPVWNSTTYLPATLTPAACGTCHGFPPATTPHNGIATPTGFPTTGCNCHPNVNPIGNSYANIFIDKTKHVNGTIEGGGCNGCHGYPPSNKRFTGSTNNWADARMENYTGGGGAHTIAGHVDPLAVAADGFAKCTPCHSEADHKTGLAIQPSNVKVSIESKVRFSQSRVPKYTSNNLDGSLHVSGTCSNVSCHFQKTPKW